MHTKIKERIRPSSTLYVAISTAKAVFDQLSNSTLWSSKKFYILGLFLFIFLAKGISQPTGNKKYLGEIPPGIQPQEFGTNPIPSDSIYVFGSVFSAAADELYYAVRLDEDWNAELWHTEYKKDRWTEPRPVALDEKFSDNDPFLSHDENRLYFMSNYAPDSDKPTERSDLWYSEKTGKS